VGALYGAQYWVMERLALAQLPPGMRFEAAAQRALVDRFINLYPIKNGPSDG
jgi:hypothetical protein